MCSRPQHPCDHFLPCKLANSLKDINIVEAPFKKWLNFYVCVVWWCANGPLNNQGQKFRNLSSLYQDIYDWISPLNKWSGRSFILTQQSMGRNEYGISGHLHIIAFLKHLMVLLRCNFFRASFYTLSKTLLVCSPDMQLRFLKVKTLLNNAFKEARGGGGGGGGHDELAIKNQYNLFVRKCHHIWYSCQSSQYFCHQWSRSYFFICCEPSPWVATAISQLVISE